MRKNPFLDTTNLEIEKTLAEFESFAAVELVRLEKEALKARKTADAFKPDPAATYVDKDSKPQEFLGQAFLLIEAVSGDDGSRPLPNRPRSCEGLEISRQGGGAVDGISPSTTYEVTCRVRNLGDLDAENVTVELFLGGPDLHPSSENFRFKVQQVFTIAGRGTVAVGRVESGSITSGQRILIQTDEGELQSVAAGLEADGSAQAGEEVGILLRGIRRDQVTVGDIILRADQLGRFAAEPAVPEVEFLGNETLRLPAFSSAEAKLEFTTSALSRPRQAVIFARVYSLVPEQLPGDFDALDCQTSRFVAQLAVP